MFPGPRSKKPPFGTRSPLWKPSPAGLRGGLKLLRPALRPFVGLMPVIGWGLIAWDLYDAYQTYYRPYGINGYTKTGECGLNPTTSYQNFERITLVSGLCPGGGALSTATLPAAWAGQNVSTLYDYWRVQNQTHPTRVFNRRFQWTKIPGHPGPFQFIPEVRGPVLPELPYPYPFAPAPYPVTAPFEKPQYEPSPSPYPDPRPAPVSPPLVPAIPKPSGMGFAVPSIDFGPGQKIRPDWHEVRKPRDDEREKKKRLKPGLATSLYQFLNKYGGSYMEIDDTVAALYKGLHWKVRRWRGKDGVWRDRDITSLKRTFRLFNAIDQLSVEKAITELIKEKGTDAAYGKVGTMLKKKTEENANAGLWVGLQGPGTTFPLSDNWADYYEMLKKREGAKLSNRFYRVRERDSDGQWVTRIKPRPVTQIPWYRQRSEKDRVYTLTGGPNAQKLRRPRYYYAESPTPYRG